MLGEVGGVEEMDEQVGEKKEREKEAQDCFARETNMQGKEGREIEQGCRDRAREAWGGPHRRRHFYTGEKRGGGIT